MPYNNNIPQPTDRIKSSQNDLLQNFSSIYTVIGIDHVNFDDVSGNQGKHNKVTFPNYSTGGSPAASADEVKLFAKAVAGVTQLFILPETASSLTAERNITGNTTTASSGEFQLPCGVKVKWGRATTGANGLGSLTYAGLGLTDFVTPYAVYTAISLFGGSSATSADYSCRSYNVQFSGFDIATYQTSGGTRGIASFMWLAIGV